jgi:hypothetical protein
MFGPILLVVLLTPLYYTLFVINWLFITNDFPFYFLMYGLEFLLPAYLLIYRKKALTYGVSFLIAGILGLIWCYSVPWPFQ